VIVLAVGAATTSLAYGASPGAHFNRDGVSLQWHRELRWRELAETPLDATQMRLKLESLEAMTTALEQLQLLLSATKPVSTGGTVSEQPDWQTRLKACRLVQASRIKPDKSSRARACPYVDGVVFEACVSPLPTLPASGSRLRSPCRGPARSRWREADTEAP